MPNIIFIEPGGSRREVDAAPGQTIMEAAVQHGVKASTRTAAVPAPAPPATAMWTKHGAIASSPRTAAELDMLEFAFRRGEGSRLTCQIKVTDGMSGLLIQLPDSQG